MGMLELACPTACACLFKVRPGVLSKTLSHMWGKLNLPIFLFNVRLLTLIKVEWSAKVGLYTGSNVVTLTVMMNT